METPGAHRSVLGERGTGVVDPLLYGGSMPLVVGIVDERLRDLITVGHQALQHHGQIYVRDRPLAEKMVVTSVEPLKCRGKQLLSGFNRLRRERGSAGTAEHDECRPLLANRHEVTAHPRLNLARSRPVAQVRGIKTCAGKGLVNVLADRGGFRQSKVVVYERRAPPGDRGRREGALPLGVRE